MEALDLEVGEIEVQDVTERRRLGRRDRAAPRRGLGPIGWGITPFEGNYYISSRYVRTSGFRSSYVPGLCVYKFIYVWMDLELDDDTRVQGLGWKYVVPNPLFPFIAFRLALPGSHPELRVERFESDEPVGSRNQADPEIS